MSAAAAPVDTGSVTHGGDVAARPGRADYQIYRVKNSQAFDMPEMVELFERAMGGERRERLGMDAHDTLSFLKSRIGDKSEWIMLWVARCETGGFSGVIILTYTPAPWCPWINVTFLYVDDPACRDKLIERAFLHGYSQGHRMVTFTNMSNHSDETYQRIFRRYGKIKFSASFLVMDTTERHAGGKL